jgi:hypothetical protein
MLCAKPLIFENEDEEFSYSMQGTGFLARYGGRYFGITSKHCLRTRTRESVRFELDETGEEFLPLKAVHLLEENNNADWDFSDLAFFEVEPNLVESANLQGHHFLDIDYFIRLDCTLKPNAILALRGYPSQFNWVDYERRVIHTQAFAVDGVFGGAAESRHCGIVKFPDLAKIDNLDGLSGSPVFQFEKNKGGFSHLFAGVLIRGSKEAGRGMFIYSSVVFKSLQLLAENAARH